MEHGLIGVNLGGHVFKKRISIKGQGKSGGARIILIYKISVCAFFIFAYAKNKKENMDFAELILARDFAKEILRYSNQELDKLITLGRLFEVSYDGKKFN